MKKGIFITFEGCEGSGKTSLIKSIYEKLTNEGHLVFKSREPGGIKIAEDIRNILLDQDNKEMDSITEVLLFAASRRQHLVDVIIPRLENGYIVLCDRFIDSSLAYQSFGRGIDYDLVYNINKTVVGEYMPDMTIFVDCTPAIGLERINVNKLREINRLDLERLDFHDKVYNGYKKIIEKESPRLVSVNGENQLSEVIEETYNLINKKINETKGN